MSMFWWACIAAVWVLALVQLTPLALRGRGTPVRGKRPASPALWAVGVVLIPVGCTLGIAGRGWDAGTRLIAPFVVLAGVVVMERFFRRPLTRN
ncbi:hypothetical protein ACWEO1_36145 [Kitasatospora cineracea]